MTISKVNGTTIHKRKMVTSSYTGNDADARQITTGFKCGLVLIQLSNNVFRCLMIPGMSILDRDGNGNVDQTSNLFIHATDGFVVENTNSGMNWSGWTFYYTAVEAD